MELDAEKLYSTLATLADRESVEKLGAELRKVVEELKNTQYTQETKMASMSKDVEILQEHTAHLKAGQKRVWEQLSELKHRPEKEALEREQETKKVARSTTVRMIIAGLLSGALILAVILLEKTYLSG